MFAIKIPEREKKAMDLVAKKTNRTLANIYYDNLLNKVHETLGAVILDSLNGARAKNEREIIMRSLLNGKRTPIKTTPKIIKEFIQMMDLESGGRRFKRIFPNIRFTEKGFLIHEINLQDLAKHMGSEYLEKGGNLDHIDLNMVNDIFFEHMLSVYYSLTAEGSLDVLQSEWNDNYPKIMMLKNTLLREYRAKFGEKFVEIFEVEPEYAAGIKSGKEDE